MPPTRREAEQRGRGCDYLYLNPPDHRGCNIAQARRRINANSAGWARHGCYRRRRWCAASRWSAQHKSLPTTHERISCLTAVVPQCVFVCFAVCRAVRRDVDTRKHLCLLFDRAHLRRILQLLCEAADVPLKGKGHLASSKVKFPIDTRKQSPVIATVTVSIARCVRHGLKACTSLMRVAVCSLFTHEEEGCRPLNVSPLHLQRRPLMNLFGAYDHSDLFGGTILWLSATPSSSND